MTIVHADQYFKVITDSYARRGVSGPRSALLKNSPHTISFSHVLPNGSGAGNHFVAPKTNGTPILFYETVEQARDFAKGDTHRRIYRAEIYGEVISVPKVLKLSLGWSNHVVPFWAAVLEGKEYAEWPTRNAPAGTLAVFGVMRLLEFVSTAA